MQVTAVRLSRDLDFNPNPRLKAVGWIELDRQFRIDYVKVIEVADGRYIVAMPSQRTRDGVWRDVCHPVDAEVRQMINKAVLEEYARI